MTVATNKSITAEELLAMGDNIGRCELLFGELVMMRPAGAQHGIVAGRFNRYLSEFVEDRRIGATFAAETGFTIERDPDLVGAPDASFVRADRLVRPLPRGYYPGVPDLAVEVVSPEDTKRGVAEKISMWLAHGTKVVWEADPRSMTVSIHRVGSEVTRLTARDSIEGEPLLPGFVLPLAKIFRNV